jgi:hypothetical protein
MPKNVGVVLTLKDRFSPSMKKVAQQLNMSNKEFAKANMSCKKFANQINGGMKAVAQSVAVGFGAIVAGSVAVVQKTTEMGDRIDKMSQKIGMSRQAFQEWDYVLSQNGGDVEKLQMGYKTLATQMGAVQKGSKETSGYFKKLGVNVKDNNGQLRKQEDVFKDVVQSLQRMKNPTEKAIIANKLFGKSAVDMKPLLNQSAESVDALVKKAHELGLVVGDDVVDASVKFKDTQDTLNRSFGALGMTIGGELIPIMQKASDFIIAHLPEIKAVAQSVINPIVNILSFCIKHIKGLTIATGIAISVFAGFKILSGIGSLMVAYTTAVEACGSATTMFTLVSRIMASNQELVNAKIAIGTIATKMATVAQWAWNTAMSANPIGLIIVGIGALIGIIVLLVKNWDKVTEAVSRAVNKLKEFIGIKPDKKKVEIETTTKDGSKKPPKHALGTPYFQGGQTSINEGGRGEIVNLPSGSQIIPHDISKNATAKNITFDVKFNVQGNLIGNRELFDSFADMLLRQVDKKLQTV